jgi:hypothetical protein
LIYYASGARNAAKKKSYDAGAVEVDRDLADAGMANSTEEMLSSGPKPVELHHNVEFAHCFVRLAKRLWISRNCRDGSVPNTLTNARPTPLEQPVMSQTGEPTPLSATDRSPPMKRNGQIGPFARNLFDLHQLSRFGGVVFG